MQKMFDAEEALRFHDEEIREEGIRGIIATVKRFSRHPEDAIQTLMEQYSLQQKTAEAKVALYW